MHNSIRFVLNEEDVELADIRPGDTLLDFLRLKRRLTGTKEGCAEGDCGACTVIVGRVVDDTLIYEAVTACIRLLGSLNATHVVTIEHLAADDGTLHPVQQAMVDFHGSQCGFCTPGFVMSLYCLWLSNDNPTRHQIEKALQGNLCRCTGYEAIIKAAEAIGQARPSEVYDPLERVRRHVLDQLKNMRTATTIDISSMEGRVVIPASVAELSDILAVEPNATIVAGSTDVGLWVTKQMRGLTPALFINHLTELQTITGDARGLTIGAGITYSRAFDFLKDSIPAFSRLIDRVGGQQVRNMGTIGGNIANGSPIGDCPPPLMALGASLRLRSKTGTRDLPLEDFYVSYGIQNRRPGEFVESIFIPNLPATARFAIYKITKRRDEDISASLGAFYLRLDGQGNVAEARIAFGGMAGTPKRARAVESALLGRPWNEATVNAARDLFDSDYQPLTDWRATAEYRRLTAKNLLIRFFLETCGKPSELRRFHEAAI